MECSWPAFPGFTAVPPCFSTPAAATSAHAGGTKVKSAVLQLAGDLPIRRVVNDGRLCTSMLVNRAILCMAGAPRAALTHPPCLTGNALVTCFQLWMVPAAWSSR